MEAGLRSLSLFHAKVFEMKFPCLRHFARVFWLEEELAWLHHFAVVSCLGAKLWDSLHVAETDLRCLCHFAGSFWWRAKNRNSLHVAVVFLLGEILLCLKPSAEVFSLKFLHLWSSAGVSRAGAKHSRLSHLAAVFWSRMLWADRTLQNCTRGQAQPRKATLRQPLTDPVYLSFPGSQSTIYHGRQQTF